MRNLLLAALLIFSFFARLAAAAEPALLPYPEAALPGGTLVSPMLGEPSNLIPPLSTDSASHEISNLIYVSPLKYDKNIKLVPYAAESFEALDEGKRLRFKLRPGIKWFDGVELTADDVEFTYKLMIDPETPTAYAEDFKMIKEFNVLGRYEFEVSYEKTFARSLSTWAEAILPKHVLEGQALNNSPQARNPVGAGPYRLKQWESGRSLTLEANPEYFEGPPLVKRLVYRIIPDSSTTFLELKAGNLDLMNLSPLQYLRQTTGGVWDQKWRKYKYLAFGYTYMGYNLDLPLFSDNRVRRALAYAVNKEEIIQGALLGLGVPTIGPYTPGTWVYNTQIKDYPYDPQKALELLREAGWNLEAGILKKDGQPFAFTILTNQGNEQRIKTATIIQHRLREIGIEVKIRTVEWAAFIKEFVDKRRFEAVLLGWTISQDPDNYDVWHSSRAVPGGLNFVSYKSPEVDSLLEAGRELLDPEKRKPIYDRYQEVLHEDQPYLFLYVGYSLPILSAKIQNVEPAPAGIDHNFIRWWIKPDANNQNKIQ